VTSVYPLSPLHRFHIGGITAGESLRDMPHGNSFLFVCF